MKKESEKETKVLQMGIWFLFALGLYILLNLQSCQSVKESSESESIYERYYADQHNNQYRRTVKRDTIHYGDFRFDSCHQLIRIIYIIDDLADTVEIVEPLYCPPKTPRRAKND